MFMHSYAPNFKVAFLAIFLVDCTLTYPSVAILFIYSIQDMHTDTVHHSGMADLEKEMCICRN